jgi:hypothetical protein
LGLGSGRALWVPIAFEDLEWLLEPFEMVAPTIDKPEVVLTFVSYSI